MNTCAEFSQKEKKSFLFPLSHRRHFCYLSLKEKRKMPDILLDKSQPASAFIKTLIFPFLRFLLQVFAEIGVARKLQQKHFFPFTPWKK